MRRLFLTSAGLPRETRDYFIKLLPKEPEHTTLAFITTAAYPAVNKDFLEKDKNHLIEIGISKINEIDFRDETENSLLNKLEKHDVIYMNGGNTFYLLDWIRKSGFNKMINSLLDSGKVYVGASAGSYVACPSIEMAAWKHQDRNRFGLKDLSGLNLVPFLISAHFEEEYRTVINEAAKNTRYTIIALNDKQAILVQDNKYKIVGKGEKTIYNGSDLIIE